MKAMEPVTITTPGKIILFGEHAVVYGRPAIAAPLSHVRARASIQPETGGGVRLVAPDLELERFLDGQEENDAFALAVRLVQDAAGLDNLPHMTITVTSQIPIASGLGSGAAISAAIIRALARFLGIEDMASDKWVSQLTYEVEKIHHGTPSGIDNTVISFERPVYFVRRQPQNQIETFQIRRPLHLLVADTGISSSTKDVVGDVRRGWQEDPDRFNALFDGCGALCDEARSAIEVGDQQKTGRLMVENHALLVDMTVSSPELDRLVSAALAGGAFGAKMSGAGRGGNMIALVSAQTEQSVRAALVDVGAQQVLRSVIQASPGQISSTPPKAKKN